MCATSGVRRGGGDVQRGRPPLRRRPHHVHVHGGPHLRALEERDGQASPPHRTLRQAAAALRLALDHDQRSHLRVWSVLISLFIYLLGETPFTLRVPTLKPCFHYIRPPFSKRRSSRNSLCNDIFKSIFAFFPLKMFFC